MSNNFLYTNTVLDEDFDKQVVNKERKLFDKYDKETLRKIHMDDLKKIGKVLCEYRPKSKIRKEKRKFLEYFDYYIKNDAVLMSDKDILSLRRKYISPSNYILESKGYVHRGLWIYFSLGSLVVDFFLTILEISKYYYYIPILFIIITISGLKREYKAKKEDKLLRW